MTHDDIEKAVRRMAAQTFPATPVGVHPPRSAAEIMHLAAADQSSSGADRRVGPQRRGSSGLALVAVAAAVVVVVVGAVTVIPHLGGQPAQPPSVSPSPITSPTTTSGSPDPTPNSTPQIWASDFTVVCDVALPRPQSTDCSYPWYGPAKAAELNAALKAALPTGLTVDDLNGYGKRIIFAPTLAQIGPSGDINSSIESPNTNAQISSPLGHGDFELDTNDVYDQDKPHCADVPDLVRRVRAKDGTIIDLTSYTDRTIPDADSAPTNRTLNLRADAYRPDGTRWILFVTDKVGKPSPDRSGSAPSGALPMTLEQMARIVSAPGLDRATPSSWRP